MKAKLVSLAGAFLVAAGVAGTLTSCRSNHHAAPTSSADGRDGPPIRVHDASLLRRQLGVSARDEGSQVALYPYPGIPEQVAFDNDSDLSEPPGFYVSLVEGLGRGRDQAATRLSVNDPKFLVACVIQLSRELVPICRADGVEHIVEGMEAWDRQGGDSGQLSNLGDDLKAMISSVDSSLPFLRCRASTTALHALLEGVDYLRRPSPTYFQHFFRTTLIAMGLSFCDDLYATGPPREERVRPDWSRECCALLHAEQTVWAKLRVELGSRLEEAD